MKIWSCGSSQRSGSRNAWTRIKNVSGASSLSNFSFFGAIQTISCRARLVTIDETCLYHCDADTKQQSKEWRHSSSHRPQKFRVQKSAAKVLAKIFWDQDGILLIDYHPMGQTTNAECYSSLLVQLKAILKYKRLGKVTKEVLFLHNNAPANGHLQPRRKWPTCASNVLITHPTLRIWPRRTTTCSLDWKTIEKSPFFVRRWCHFCRGDVVGRTTIWFFFEWFPKVRATG